ncbi:hypothetical protein DRO56_03675 [Candidatus Bathyarchaeota archaeon]|nr:MAG: hypothetical protein DRO56_03675 [Candidatus Bathyarchaeota archaeon]
MQGIRLGEVLTLRTMRGRRGNIIGRLPDGRIALFSRRSPHLDALRPNQNVECRVVHIAQATS